MASTTFSWIHLTDFHYGLDGQDTLWPNLRKPFFDDLAEMHKRTGPWQVVFFTGDLVQQGRAQEFAAMQREVLVQPRRAAPRLRPARLPAVRLPRHRHQRRPRRARRAHLAARQTRCRCRRLFEKLGERMRARFALLCAGLKLARRESACAISKPFSPVAPIRGGAARFFTLPRYLVIRSTY